MRNRFSITIAISILVLPLLAAPVLYFSQPVQALSLENRSLEIGTSEPSANTTHNFQFELSSATPVGSIEFEYCTNDPFIGQPCTVPTGLNVDGAGIDLQSGQTGFSIHPNTNANTIVITRAPSAPGAVPASVQYIFDNVINPSFNGTTFVRMATYASTDATGPVTDSAATAFSTAEGLGIGAFVPPYLTFCVGVTITANNCATANGNSINYGDLSPDAASTATSQMAAATNAPDGYSISMIGNTMTSGNNTIPALDSPTASDPGRSQFGLNLRRNTNPAVGSNVTGGGSASPTSDYGIQNRYLFRSGDIIAESDVPSESNTFTAAYVVNVSDDQQVGVYSTTISYICLGSF